MAPRRTIESLLFEIYFLIFSVGVRVPGFAALDIFNPTANELHEHPTFAIMTKNDCTISSRPFDSH
jgi:hypothetical protein